jgi:putative transposase
LVSIDFFTVSTLQLKELFVFVVVAYERRRVLHFNVTDHPTAEWTAQQVIEAFPEDTTRRYLIRDRDGVYGSYFRDRVPGTVFKKCSPPRAVHGNPFAERLIGSIRRECLNTSSCPESGISNGF